MTTFEFTAALAPPASADASEDIAERLYGGLRDDCSVHTDGPTVLVDFHREAGSFPEAVASVVADLRAEGLEVARIEIHAEDFAPLLAGAAPAAPLAAAA